MTPLTKGRRKFIAKEENNALTRARVDREESKMASVADTGTLVSCERCRTGEEFSVCSGKDIEGKDEVMDEGTSSHF